MEITAVSVQTVEPNQNVLFTNEVVSGNCSILHRSGSGNVKLRGLTSTQCRARFKVSFNGNIAVPTGGTVGPIQLSIAIDGESNGAAIMIATPAAVGEYFNVSSEIYIDVPKGCCSIVSVENSSTINIEVQNANLIVERVA